MISSEGAIHLGADDGATATLPQAMTREGDNETSARAARRKAGYVSFELEITFVTAYMILGVKKRCNAARYLDLPKPGAETNTASKRKTPRWIGDLKRTTDLPNCSYVNQKNGQNRFKYLFWS